MKPQDMGFDPRDLPRNADAARRLSESLLDNGRGTTDAEQDVLLHTLRKPPTIQQGWKSWFRGAVRRRRLHLYREETSRAHREQVAGRRGLEGRCEDPQAIVERAETCERLMSAVMGLPEPYRTPLILRYVEEHDTQRISEMLGRPLSTVQTQLLRGLSLLRSILRTQDQRNGGDWKAALGLFCPPSLAAVPAASTQAPSGGFSIAGKVSLLALGITLSVLLPSLWNSQAVMEDQARSSADEFLEEQEAAPKKIVGRPPESSSRGTEELPPVSPAALTAGVQASGQGSRNLSLSILSAKSRHPIPLATGRLDANASDPGSHADKYGRIVLRSTDAKPSWLMVEAAGFVSARVLAKPGAAALEVLLSDAGTITVESNVAGGRLLAARTWPVRTFPIALRPIPLKPTESGLDADGILQISVAPGEYVLSALCELEGERQFDLALVSVQAKQQVNWIAFDTEERDLILRSSGMPPRAQHWAAALLLGSTGQKVGSAEGSANEPLHFSSVPPGEHQLQVFVDGVALMRKVIHIPPGAGLEQIAIEVPAASLSLTVPLLADLGSPPMVILRGPLDSELSAPRTHFKIGTEVKFSCLSPGDYAAWVRTGGRVSRTALTLHAGFNQAAVSPEQGINATLIFSAQVPLGRTESLLIAGDGARIPLTTGEEFGSQATFGNPPTGNNSDPRNSINLSLPAGSYELATTVDGESRPRQRIVVPAQGSLEVRPPPAPEEIQLLLHRDGTPIASQAAELTGHLAGHSPLDVERGELWMLSCLIGERGYITQPLAPAMWTVSLAGGETRSFEVTATTREVSVNFNQP